MQLYIVGPAFGLPSIDAECIAAVALLQSRGDADWGLIATHDEREGLPLLVDNGLRISGFKAIRRHLSVGSSLHTTQQADSTALSAFLQSNAQTLLDISLYVSFENYSSTRSAFTKILPWHTNYLLPPRRRAAARTRTEHLGISSIDVDNVHEDLSGRPSGFDGVGKEQQGFEVEAQKRASLLLPRKETVRSLLQRPQHSAVFKLHMLADNFFGPLQDVLAGKQYFLGDEMTGVDCLAFGYLSLMLYPQLPQNWLAATLRRKYGKLVEYVERMHRKLELQTNVGDVMASSSCSSDAQVAAHRTAHKMTLPWAKPTTPTILDIATMTSRELLSHVPMVGQSTTTVTSKPTQVPLWQRYLPALLGLTAGSLGLSLYVAFRTGTLVWPHGEAVHVFGRKRFADYGHLGAALAGISVLGQQARGDAAFHAQVVDEAPVQVEVEVERNASTG